MEQFAFRLAGCSLWKALHLSIGKDYGM